MIEKKILGVKEKQFWLSEINIFQYLKYKPVFTGKMPGFSVYIHTFNDLTVLFYVYYFSYGKVNFIFNG